MNGDSLLTVQTVTAYEIYVVHDARACYKYQDFVDRLKVLTS